MKKLFLVLILTVMTFSFAMASDKETPSSIYEKILEKSYIGKYKSIIIDKELTSTQISNGMSIRSKTYFAYDKYREETATKDTSGQTINIITIFTSSDTYMSYNQGETFLSFGTSLIDEISSNIKNIDSFTLHAVLKEKMETVNGSECYAIEDNGMGINRKFYVEKKTYNLLKSIISTEEMLIVTELSNYKKVDKYTGPFTIQLLIRKKTGDKQTIESNIKIHSIQFNPSINSEIFSPKNVSAIPNIYGIGNIKDMLQSIF
ncbi:MAG: outer membrane lipoprotein-sorting protein [Endomicrobium sp.]|jgi:hypothetical protein|nr:outer membrane lipoprotein-sorting protein [Endomicrobium sp.]